MNRLRIVLILAACSITVFASGQTPPAEPGFSAENPFAKQSNLPYQAPPFDKIKDSDYQPAIEEGMRQELAEIETIANNPDAPTFENTIVAMEKTGELLRRAGRVFGSVAQSNTNPTLQKVQTACWPTHS